MKDIKTIIQGLVNIGIPINVIARQVKKDGSTIGKWLRGQTNISDSLEAELYLFVWNLNKQWKKIMSDVVPYPEDNEGGVDE